MNKKGAEMTIGTIVIIVLALVVLVVLILGFTGGWGNLWGRISSFFGGANVDSIVQACQVACTTNSKYDFCDRDRIVKLEDKTEIKDKTCNELADSHKNLGFEKCGNLCPAGGNGGEDELAAHCATMDDDPSACGDDEDCRVDTSTGKCVKA